MKLRIVLMVIIIICSVLGMQAQTIEVINPNASSDWKIGSTYTIQWVKRGDMDNQVRIKLFNEAGIDLVYSIADREENNESYTWRIPNEINEGRYRIKVFTVDRRIIDLSDVFRISPRQVMPDPNKITNEFKVLAPVKGDRVYLGEETVIRWKSPALNSMFHCGNQVDIYAVRNTVDKGILIARNLENNPGENTYRWHVRTPVFLDVLGNYRIKIVSQRDCKALSGLFEIVRRGSGDMPSERCDFSLDQMVFANGQPLNHGIAYRVGENLTGNFLVSILWNGVNPSTEGNHTIEVKSVLTHSVISTGNVPAAFSYRNADGRRQININVPFQIVFADVARMQRGRFIPLEFKINFSPAANDSFSRNNRKEAEMRILDAGPTNDLQVFIDRTSLRTSKKINTRKRRDEVKLWVTIKSKNLSRDEMGRPPVALRDVRVWWWIGEPGVIRKQGYFTCSQITGEWFNKNLFVEFILPVNYWKELEFHAILDHDRQVNDPNRSNNEDKLNFEAK